MNFTNYFFLARFVITYVSLFTFINIKGTVSHLKIWVGGGGVAKISIGINKESVVYK